MQLPQGASIAVIGAGVAGLPSAKWLTQYGFKVTIFETKAAVGGLWNAENNSSPIWERLHLNTSRFVNQYSDFPVENVYSTIYPSWQDHLKYLQAYAEHFHLNELCRFNTTVTRVAREGDDKWRLTSKESTTSKLSDEVFDHVVVAVGLFKRGGERIYEVDGIETFKGKVLQASQVWDFSNFQNKRCVVVGGSISAAEIATSLTPHAASVHLSIRTPRFVGEKWMQGKKPMELCLFSRFPGLLMQAVPPAIVYDGLRKIMIQNFGDLSTVGGKPRLDPSSIIICEGYFHHLAQGSINESGDIDRIEGNLVHFKDGSSTEADVLISCIGYNHHLPFLEPDVLATLHEGGNTDWCLDLAHLTFPKEKNMSFCGYVYQAGGQVWTFELQARMIAYMLAGVIPGLNNEQLDMALQECRGMRSHIKGIVPAPVVAHTWSKLIGCAPPIGKYPELANVMMFKGCMTPFEHRLVGPDADETKYLAQYRKVLDFMFDGQPPAVPAPEDLGALKMVAEKLDDANLKKLVQVFESLPGNEKSGQE